MVPTTLSIRLAPLRPYCLLLVHWAFDSKKLVERERASHILQNFVQSQLNNCRHSLSVDRSLFVMLSDLECSDIHARDAGVHCCHMAQVGDPAKLEEDAHWPQVET
eukprot:2607766-Heterocapsa_arctica.AAC.1